jgi:hypothetical protein
MRDKLISKIIKHLTEITNPYSSYKIGGFVGSVQYYGVEIRSMSNKQLIQVQKELGILDA